MEEIVAKILEQRKWHAKVAEQVASVQAESEQAAERVAEGIAEQQSE
jgi:hypothetical protein